MIGAILHPSGGMNDAAGKARSRKVRLRRLGARMILCLVIAYVLWLALLYCVQDRILFPVDLIGKPSGGPPKGVESLWLDLPDGGRVEGWLILHPDASAERPRPLVVYFHGNGELIDQEDDVVAMYRQAGVSVFLPEYRGYGRSGGRPSQKGITADTVRFHDLVVQRSGVDASRIVYHGRSLGGGVAAALAAQRPPSAMILESTFASVARMAWRYGAPPVLIKHPFRTDRVVQAFCGPLLIFHGSLDRIVPVSHGRRLKTLASSAEYVEYPCGHNDFPGIGRAEEYRARIAAFLCKAGITREGERDMP